MSQAPHINRTGHQRRAKSAPAAEVVRRPGYFTEPVRAWWPDFKSQLAPIFTKRATAAQCRAADGHASIPLNLPGAERYTNRGPGDLKGGA